MTLLFADRPEIVTCRSCGCDDNHACVSEAGPCAWVLLDVPTPTGVCSACAIRAGWDQRFLAIVWNLESGEEEAA